MNLMPIIPRSPSRLYRWTPAFVLLVSFVVTQVLLRGPTVYLSLGRILITPFVLSAAAFVWPLFLKDSRLAASLAGRVALFAASLVTTILAVLAIPLWAGHGCWAPDLGTLCLFLLAGFLLCIIAACLTPVICGIESERLNRLAIFIAIAFLVTAFSPSLFPRLMSMRSAPVSGDIEVLWSKRPLEGTLVSIKPLPWSKAAFCPADPAVSSRANSTPGPLLFIDTPDRLQILDPASGNVRRTVDLPRDGVLPGDTAKSTWNTPLIEGSFAVLRRPNSWYPLDLVSGSLGSPVTGDELRLCPHGIVTLTGRIVKLVDWSGIEMWKKELRMSQSEVQQTNDRKWPDHTNGPGSTGPGNEGDDEDRNGDGGVEPGEFAVNEFYPLDPPPRTIVLGTSLLVGVNFSEHRGEIAALDLKTGAESWRRVVKGGIRAMTAFSYQLSPWVDRQNIPGTPAPPDHQESCAIGDPRGRNSIEASTDLLRREGAEATPAVYIVVQSGDGNFVQAISLSGNLLWSLKLPERTYGISWAPTPMGLALAISRLTTASPKLVIAFVDRSGEIGWETSIPREPYSMRYQGGVLVVTTSTHIRAYSPEKGELLWCGEPPVHRAYGRATGTVPFHFEYYRDFLTFREELIVPVTPGIVSFDARTGERRWTYVPPGGCSGMTTDGNAIFATNSRGILAFVPRN